MNVHSQVQQGAKANTQPHLLGDCGKVSWEHPSPRVSGLLASSGLSGWISAWEPEGTRQAAPAPFPAIPAPTCLMSHNPRASGHYSGDLPLLLNSTGCWKQLAGHDPWAEPCHWRWSKCYPDSQAALLRLNHPSFSSSSWWEGGFKTDCPLQQSDVMVTSLVSARQGSSKPCPFPSLPTILWSWARFPSCKSQLFTCTVGIKLHTSRTCLSRTNVHPIHHDLPLPLFLLTDTASVQCKGQDQAET